MHVLNRIQGPLRRSRILYGVLISKGGWSFASCCNGFFGRGELLQTGGQHFLWQLLLASYEMLHALIELAAAPLPGVERLGALLLRHLPKLYRMPKTGSSWLRQSLRTCSNRLQDVISLSVFIGIWVRINTV